MHPDKKVGMALGILLVGIVAAFFFRNDSKADEDQDSRRLASAGELEERIRQGAQVPYFPDRDEGSADLGSVPDINIADLIDASSDVPEIGDADSVVIPHPIRVSEPGPAHDLVTPIPTPGSDLRGIDAALDRSGSLTGIFTPTRSSSGPGAKPACLTGIFTPTRSSSGPGAKPAWKIHEVTSGETLSGLASKYLGTHRRYQELFEANRDVLKSPDALRVGMRLRIPSKQKPTARVPAPRVAPDPTKPAVAPESGGTSTPAGTANPPKPKFVRPSGVVPRISANPQRSLSQRPPPGVPHVEGLDPILARRRTTPKSARREEADGDESGTR